MDSLENVCQNTQRYKAIAGPEFPYLKGGKTFHSNLATLLINTSTFANRSLN